MIFSKSILIQIIFFTLLLASCKQAKPAIEEEIKATASPVPTYPSLSNQDISLLYSLADKVDMIFYEMPISVNQDDAVSAKNSVLYISPAPVVINKECKSIGRLSWISDGAIVKEADIYIDSLCQYFIFMDKNMPVAANAMSESGVYFFNNIIEQVQQRNQK
jgi:hypothetical protein